MKLKSSWHKATGDEKCAECGDTMEEGQDIFYDAREDGNYCEGCHEDMIDDEAGSWNNDDYEIDGVGFAEPGGRSSLRAETEDNPRDRPCPTCGEENALTRLDVVNHYQCNRCADIAEGREGY